MSGKDQETTTTTTTPAEGPLNDEQKREQRALLIKALSRFKPEDASPLQFYNCVRELCIMHNCGIDEGLERASLTWPALSQRQRKTYDSQRHAELPIPVPRHLLYQALQKERSGLWSLGRSSTGSKYTLEAYKPSPKPSRLTALLQEQRPKYDNLLNLSPKVAAMRVPPPPKPRVSRISPSSGRRIRSPTPPPAGVRSTSHIPPRVGSEKIIKSDQRRQEKQPHFVISPILKRRSDRPSTSSGSHIKKVATRNPKKDIKMVYKNWEQAVSNIRKRLAMHH